LRKQLADKEEILSAHQLEIERKDQVIAMYKLERDAYGIDKVDSITEELNKAIRVACSLHKKSHGELFESTK